MDCIRQAPLSVGILQARTVERVAMPSSGGSSWSRDPTCVSCVPSTGRQVITSATWEAASTLTLVCSYQLCYCRYYISILLLLLYIFLDDDIWRRQWHSSPVPLPGKSHRWRSLVGCSPWDCWESDTAERLHFHFSLSCTGEGNGNPLHCSCLENPRDGGAWWAAAYGVAQSQTRLRRLSRSRSRWWHCGFF